MEDSLNVPHLVLEADGTPAKDRHWPEMPPLVEHAECLLWHRTRRIPTSPELVRLAEVAIGLGLPDRFRRRAS